ncbi:hypothetical protein BV133_2534 [Blastochloris viridis]|uniref:Uncharacterized protein n=1 Tax=Blastochloris viridis TaxID=1079 RepID=A0A182D5A6_BLAVI|nr:hypothetical protein BV133_2534 [Blastochloris viridis]
MSSFDDLGIVIPGERQRVPGSSSGKGTPCGKRSRVAHLRCLPGTTT